MVYKHLQYGLPMINDVIRNKFYKSILEDVNNKTCLEIGFGSGILSILAIEAGAKHIIAYEEMEETYDLGSKVIQELNLQDKITLISDQFTSDKIENHPNIDLIFTETINHTLWGESLLHAIRHNNLPTIIPNKYFLELHVVEISKNYAYRLLNSDISICNPGIEITHNFNKIINQILNKEEIELDKGMHGISLDNLYKVLDICDVTTRVPNKTYTVDINNPPALDTIIDWEINLDQNKNYIVIPRTGMSYKNSKLYTDVCDNWGAFAQYAIILNAQTDFKFKQNFYDGNIVFAYGDQQIHLIKEEHSHNYDITETDNVKVINYVH